MPEAGAGGVCMRRRIQDSERFREGCRTALFVLLFFLVLFAAGFLTATAQTYPRGEAFAGFSYARLNLGQQAGLFEPTGQNYYGMQMNASFNPKPYMRILLCDFAAEMGKTAVSMRPLRTDLRETQVLFGPEFVLRSGRTAPFAHTLVGLTNTRLVSMLGGYDVVPDVAARTNLAFGAGGGLDVRWTRLITVRVVAADYVPTRIGGNWENHFRTSSGVVFTWNYRDSGAGR